MVSAKTLATLLEHATVKLVAVKAEVVAVNLEVVPVKVVLVAMFYLYHLVYVVFGVV